MAAAAVGPFFPEFRSEVLRGRRSIDLAGWGGCKSSIEVVGVRDKFVLMQLMVFHQKCPRRYLLGV